MIRYFPFLILMLWHIHASGQTCCSGGVPLSGNIGMPASEKGVVQFSFSVDHNMLRTLMSEDEVLNDQSRSRITNSILIEGGYAWTSRFFTDFFFSYVEQNRKIRNFGSESISTTRGFGDAVILLKFRVNNLDSRNTFLLGTGPKLPVGSSDQRNPGGILYAADLQPGSGALDWITWSNYSTVLSIRPSMRLNFTAIWRSTGINRNYLQSLTYEFGNEIQLLASIADRINIGRIIFDPSVNFRYRKAFGDKVSGNILPNSGGQWLFIAPGFNLSLNTIWSYQVNIELPLYSYVTGTQVTPTYRINSGLFMILNTNSSNSENIMR